VLAGFQPALLVFMDDIQRQIDEVAEPTEVLRNFSTNLAELSAANSEVTAIVMTELLTLDPERWPSNARIPTCGPIRTVMTVARAQGRLRPEVSVEHATDLFLSCVLNVIRTYIATGHPDRIRPMLAATLEIFLNGAFRP
jgi:hypothetical protein